MGGSRSLRAIVDPERVAVVGASATPGTPGWVLWHNLEGFPGERLAISRSAQEIDGVPAYPTLCDAPGPIDLAVVAVAAAAVPEVIQDAARAGVRACVIVSAGFAESGDDGRALQEKMLATARDAGILLMGPNCLGVQNWDVPLNASLSAGSARGGGGISVITQSGSYAMALHALSEDDGLGFAVAFSAGNRCDIDDAEVIDHLRTDDRTRVICLFAESMADGERFLDVARRTTEVKPLVVTAVGRSEAGARSAASHTAAMAGDRRAWDDVMSAVGVTVTHSGLEMLDAARVLALQPLPGGARAAIITNSGGTGTELSDLLAGEGIAVPPLSAGLRERLDALMPGYASSANPIDVTPAWTRFAQMYPAVLEEVARSGEVDLVIPVLLHRSAESPEVAAAIAEAVSRLQAEGVGVPVYVCWVARRSAWPIALGLQEQGIPCLEWPERTARAVGHAVRYAAGVRRRSPADVPRLPRPVSAPSAGPSRDLAVVLANYGVPLVRSVSCATAKEAVAAAEAMGYPVVAKVEHPTLSHKSDVGGVRLSLGTGEEVATAVRELLTLADGARVLIQAQLSGAEVAIGALREETFGPVVAVGLGGVNVELLDDMCFAPAPLTRQDAVQLLERTRAATLLRGYRGAPGAGVGPMADLVCRVGDLLVDRVDLLELDLNPVMVGAHGLLAVDARATWS